MNTFLETGISLVLLFFIFSIITYVIQELIAVNLKFRSKMLWRSLEHLLEGKPEVPIRTSLLQALPEGISQTSQFYAHPQIASLQRKENRKPAYIPAANFALAIMDMVAGAVPAQSKTGNLFNDIKTGLKAYTDSGGKFGAVLRTLLETSSTIQELQAKIENWYNLYMQRVTGWYEAHTVASVRIIALALALVFNVNIINLTKQLYTDSQVRTGMVRLAEGFVDNPATAAPYLNSVFEKKAGLLTAGYTSKIDSADSTTEKDKLRKELGDSLERLAAVYTSTRQQAMDSLLVKLKATGLPLGWKAAPDGKSYWAAQGPANDGITNFLLAILGWLIAAGCFSMGAPFWFDMMGKLVNVRRSGIKPDKQK